MHHHDILALGLLLLLACVVALVARRIGLPYVVGLVLAGVALRLAGYHGGLALTPDLIFTVLLPPLIFEAALHLGWQQFRREAPLVLGMAFGGTMLSACVVAGGMHWGAGWGWQASWLFGALIAATDPVSVIAMMKEQNAPPRLRFLMEAESIVNDGAAAVLFALVAAWIAGREGSASGAAMAFVTTAGGGVVCGLVTAGALLLVARGAQDPLVEIALTVLAAYGAFLLAEELHVSGVLATLAAGMLVGNAGRGLSQGGRQAALGFWDFAAFLANSIVFLLIGIDGAGQPLATYAIPAGVAIAAVLLGRAVAVYPVATLFAGGPLAVEGVTRRILFWGGLRGALALALALAAPAVLPERDALIGVTFAVVAFSIFVQGLTMPRLLRAAE